MSISNTIVMKITMPHEHVMIQRLRFLATEKMAMVVDRGDGDHTHGTNDYLSTVLPAFSKRTTVGTNLLLPINFLSGQDAN